MWWDERTVLTLPSKPLDALSTCDDPRDGSAVPRLHASVDLDDPYLRCTQGEPWAQQANVAPVQGPGFRAWSSSGMRWFLKALASDAGLLMEHRHLVTEALERRAAWRVTEELGKDEAATSGASVSDLHWWAWPLLGCTGLPLQLQSIVWKLIQSLKLLSYRVCVRGEFPLVLLRIWVHDWHCLHMLPDAGENTSASTGDVCTKASKMTLPKGLMDFE